MTDTPAPAAPRETSGKAIAALVVAIGGFFVCAPIGGMVAVIIAGNAKRQIRESGGRLGGEELATAARIIGWVGVVVGTVVMLSILAITFLGQATREPAEYIEQEPVAPRVVIESRAAYTLT